MSQVVKQLTLTFAWEATFEWPESLVFISQNLILQNFRITYFPKLAFCDSK